VEVVADNAVTTWFDENLIFALKRAWPSELVMVMGKARGVVGQPARELREGSVVSSGPNSVKSTSDPAYEGMGVAVCTEWKSSAGVWQLTLMVKMGFGPGAGRGRGRFYGMLSERDNRDKRWLLTFNQANIAA